MTGKHIIQGEMFEHWDTIFRPVLSDQFVRYLLTNMEEVDFENKEEMKDKHIISDNEYSTNWKYYDDNLDLDQQSQEFWDQF